MLRPIWPKIGAIRPCRAITSCSIDHDLIHWVQLAIWRSWMCQAAPPHLWYLLAPFRAMCLAFTYRHSRTRDYNRVRDGVVDLILNRSVGRPTGVRSACTGPVWERNGRVE